MLTVHLMKYNLFTKESSSVDSYLYGPIYVISIVFITKLELLSGWRHNDDVHSSWVCPQTPRWWAQVCPPFPEHWPVLKLLLQVSSLMREKVGRIWKKSGRFLFPMLTSLFFLYVAMKVTCTYESFCLYIYCLCFYRN